jgi:hypothetical protein
MIIICKKRTEETSHNRKTYLAQTLMLIENKEENSQGKRRKFARNFKMIS